MKIKKKKRFISEHYKDKTAYFVFYCQDTENPKRESCEAFIDRSKAYSTMNDYLIEGLCSWVVIYNG